MAYRRLLLAVLAAVLSAALLLVPSAASAQVAVTGVPSIYRLAQESAFEEGCFDPCLCPVQFRDGLIGTMRLVPAAPQPGFAVYEVRDVNWLVPGLEHWVTGSGAYRVGGQPLMHRLELDLQVADREVQHYDSGLGLATGGPPGIAITISMNDMVCHDTVFHLVARPIAMQEARPYALHRSAYAEGCFGPCDCLTIEKPLTGRFGLLPIAERVTGADFAVLNFTGYVREPGASTLAAGWPVGGVGIYRVGLPAGDRRLRLELSEDGRPPVRFDSGTVPGDGHLGRIDIDVAENGFACYDRVYSIHARRRPWAVMTFQAIAPDPAPRTVEPAP